MSIIYQHESQPILIENITVLAKKLLLKIHNDCTFDKNYKLNVVLASVISASGFLTNNSVIIVASMLISPIMSPIIGMSFGTILKDNSLIKKSIVSELGGVFLCLITGFIFGLSSSPFMNELDVPGSEMLMRATEKGFLFATIIAFAAGIAGSLLIIMKNVSSIVGVGISASLLPPIVNTCIFCGLAINNYNLKYKSSMLLWFGFLSLILFIINIICIYISSIITFNYYLPILTNKEPIKDYFTESKTFDNLRGEKILRNVENYLYSANIEENINTINLLNENPSLSLDIYP